MTISHRKTSLVMLGASDQNDEQRRMMIMLRDGSHNEDAQYSDEEDHHNHILDEDSEAPRMSYTLGPTREDYLDAAEAGFPDPYMTMSARNHESIPAPPPLEQYPDADKEDDDATERASGASVSNQKLLGEIPEDECYGSELAAAKRKRDYAIFAAVSLVVVIAVTCGMIFGFMEDRTVNEEYMLNMLPESTILALNQTGSPQANALEWLLQDPHLQSYSDERLATRFALATMYHALDGPSWNNASHWMNYSKHECNWGNKETPLEEVLADFPGDLESVTSDLIVPTKSCDDGKNRLHHLRLDGMGLNGSLPLEVQLLTNLRSLSLDQNFLNGLLPDLAALSHLEELSLMENFLVGPIPVHLGLLSNHLTHLFLSKNQLTGTIPGMQNFTQLKTVLLDHNQLQGGIPEFGPSLEWLSLGHNNLAGSVPPTLAKLTTLKRMDLSKNLLAAPLPSVFNALSNLEVLDLEQNKLTGASIPAEWAGMISLKRLLLGNSNIHGGIPFTMNYMHKLEGLTLSNNHMTGPIPTFANCSSLQYLLLDSNRFSKSIPSEIGLLTSLQVLDVSNNTLQGKIPSSLGGLTSLQDLMLHFNSLTGGIPTSLNDMTNLVSVVINNNKVQGAIPNIGNLKRLRTLQASSNELTRLSTEIGLLRDGELTELILNSNFIAVPIPSELGLLSGTLERLSLSHNQFYDTIPSEISLLTRLNTLSAYENSLQGSLPSELKQLTNLEAMYLHSNFLTGALPKELFEMTHVGVLMLAHNNFTSLPTEIGLMKDLRQLVLDDCQLEGTLHSELGLLANMSVLAVSHNKLTGTIPPEIAQATHLINLHVNENLLSGPIATELGTLSWLTTLKLDDNILNSTIPSEFGMLTQLQLLDLSTNYPLTGSVPSELSQMTSLIHFHAHHSHIIGNLPVELGNLAVNGSLSSFAIGSTLIYGTVPEALCQIDTMSFDCRGALCGCDCQCGHHTSTITVNCLETPEKC